MDKRLKAHDALKLKADLQEKVIGGAYIRYMDSFLRSFGSKPGGFSKVTAAHPVTNEPIDDLTTGGAWCLMEYQNLVHSDTYLIGAQMNPLVRQAASDVPLDMKFDEYSVPSRHGFLVFEDPWTTIDVAGRHLLTRVLTWQPMKDQHGNTGVQVTEYSALSDKDDVSRDILALGDRAVDKMMGDLQVQHLIALRFGSSIGEGVNENWDDNMKRAAVGPAKAVMALWTLMQQRVTEEVVPSMTPRSEARWERKRVAPKVRVINLRHRRIVSQTAAQHESQGTREWSGRWMVKGHWRNQPHGPGRQERHWVYIHPFLKGPDDKPFIERPTVYKLSR